MTNIYNEMELLQSIKENNTNVTIPVLHITQQTNNYGSTYGQDIEPTGKYLSYNNHKFKLDIENYNYTIETFEKALVLEYKSTDSNGWKKDLSDMFNGSIKKRLSNKIIKAGYDVIITIDSDNKEIKEIVSLKEVK